jgi:hypothetical protein
MRIREHIRRQSGSGSFEKSKLAKDVYEEGMNQVKMFYYKQEVKEM